MIVLEGTNLGMAFKKLRETKGMSSVELSEAVGISDYNYFSRVFRSVTGLTPRDFRKKRRHNA